MKKIIIIKYSAIGDVLRTTVLLPALKKKFPKSEIFWITEAKSRPVLENNPLIKGIYLEYELTDCFKKKEYDLIINLDEDFDACQLAGELKSKKLLGYYFENGKIVCTKGAKYWMAMSLLGGVNRDALKKRNKFTYPKIIFDIAQLSYSTDFKPIIHLRRKEKEFGLNFAKKHNIKLGYDYVVGINTGAGKRWPLKKLGIGKTSLLINKLLKKELKVILCGGEEEVERNSRILKACNRAVIDAGCNNSVREFASLISICDSIISADTLAMHISIALGKYTLAFFGPTPFQEIEFHNNGEAVVAPLGCTCCMKKVICEKKSNCMDLINENLLVDKVMFHKQRLNKKIGYEKSN